MSRRTPLVALGFLLVLVTCRDGMEPRLQLAPLAVAPVLPSEAALASFGLTLDHVRFIVVRGSPPDTLVDTTVVLPPDQDALDLNLRVALVAAAETLQVSVVALSGTIPLFQGTSQVEVLSGATAQPTEIPVLTYVGPGAGVDSLAISPAVPFIYFNDSVRFQVQAFQGGAPVSQFYVSWSTSDSSVARINSTGLLRARASRNTVRVIARTPGGAAADSTTATIVPVPTQFAIISGAGQSGLVGQPLSTPLEVEVRAADNLPVGGVAVRFRAPAGGSPADTTITTGPSGRALVNAVLGPTPGNQTFQVSLPAFPSVVASFTAAATSTTISPIASTITVSTGSVISGNTVKLRLQGKDAGGSNITSGGDIIVFSASGGSSTGAISATADSGNGVYTAVFTGLLAGTATTIGATINGTAVSTPLPTVSVSPGLISAGGSTVTVSPSTIVAGNIATLRLRAKDAAGNLVPTGNDIVVFGISGASGGTIGLTADSGNGVYTATFTGLTAGSASTVTATINGNAVTSGLPSITVTPAAAAQLAFTVQPTNALVATPITPAVEVTARDLYGNTTPAFTGAVTIAIGTNPSSGVLSGTLAPAAVAGLAKFTDLQIDQSGVGYTLTATANGLASATSASFDVLVPSGTITWSSSSGGNWSTPTNWTGGVVPGPTNTAVITLPGTYTVTLDVNPTVNGLQLGGSSGTQTLVAASRTLTVTGTAQVTANGLLQLKASTLSGGTLSNSGLVFVEGSTTISSGIATTAGSLIRLQGNGVYSTAVLTVPNAFTNNGTIRLTDTTSSYGATLNVTSGTLTNAVGGVIDVAVGTGGPRTLGAQLDNQGAMNLNAALTLSKPSAAHVSSGAINVNAGNFTISQTGTSPSFTNSGALRMGAGDSIKVSSGAFIYNAPSTISGGTLSLASVSVTADQPFNTQDGGLSLASTTWGGAGTLTVDAGTTLDWRASTMNAPLSNQGTLVVNGISAFNGPVSNVSGATLKLQGNGVYSTATLTVANNFTNTGAIVLTDTTSSYGAALNMPAGTTLTNGVGGTIDVALGTNGPRTLGTQLDNQGTLTLHRSLTISRAGATHTNSGTIDLQVGNLLVSQSGTTPSFTNAGGSITMAAADSVQVSSGAFTWNGGAITGGTLSFTSTAVTLGQDFSTATAGLSLASTSWAGAGILTIAPATTVVWRASTISAPLVNQGTLVINGTSAFNGPFSNDLGATLQLQGNGVYSTATLTVANSFTNNGAIALTDITSSYGATLNMPAGATLTNASGGTIDALVGSAGPRTLGLELDNQGALTVHRDLTLSRAGAAHVNSGTIDLISGDLSINQSGTSPSFTNSGAINISAADTVKVSSGTFNYAGGSISGGTFSLTSATVNATQSFSTATAALTLANSTWGGSGTLTVAPSTSVTVRASTINSALDNQGTLIINGTSAFNGAVTTGAGTLLHIEGNGTYSTATLTVANGFTNNGTIELTDVTSSYGAILNVTAGTLVNAPGATISSLAGTLGPRTLNAQLDNQGALNVAAAANQGLTMNKASAVHQNTGTITITGGDLVVSGAGESFTNTGSISVAAGDTLRVSAGSFTHNAGSISGAGALQLSNANGAFNVAHTIASMVLTSSTTSFATPQSTGSTGFVFASSTINGPGTLTNDPSRFLAVRGSTINTALDNQGTLLVNGTSTFNGTLTTGTSSLIRVQGNGTYSTATMTVLNGFTNNGTIELTDTTSSYGATLNVTNGALTNAAGASITATPGFNGPRTIGATLDNQGTMTVALNAGRTLTISKTSAVHQNSGTIDLTGGDLTFSQSGAGASFTTSGVVNIGAGDTLTVNGGGFTYNGTALGGGGTLVLSSVNPAAFNAAHTVAAMNVTSTTVNFATPQATGTTGFTFSSSTINGPGSLTNDVGKTLDLRGTTVNAPLSNLGTLLIHGTSAANDTLTMASTSLIRIQGNGTYSSANLTVAKGLENTGTIVLTDTTSTYGATLTVTNGSLVNMPGAAINVLAGAGGPRTLAAALDNRGALSVATAATQALTLTKAGADHLNSGTVDITSGDLTINQSGTTPSFTNDGGITIGTGDTLRISGGAFTHNSGTLGGGGALVLSSVSPAQFAVAHSVSAMLVTSSTVNFATPQTTGATGFSFTSSTINGPGSLTNDPGKTLDLRGTTVNAPFSNLGTLLVHGTSAANDTLTTAGTSLIRIQGNGTFSSANLTVAKGFENAGTIELTDTTSTYGATLTATNGSFVNLPGAQVNVMPGAGGPRTINAQLDNQGAIAVGLATTGTLTINRANSAHSNTGTIDVTGGDVTIVQSGTTPSFTNLGAVTVGGGDTLTISGGTFTFGGGALDGPGTMVLSSVNPANFSKPHTLGSIIMTSSTASFSADDSTASTTFLLTSSTLNGPGALTNSPGKTLNVRGSTIAAPLINQGLLLVNGVSSITGPFTTAAGSTLRLQGNGTYSSANLTVNNGLVNNGAIELTDTTSSYGATLVVKTLPLVNAAGATVDLLPGAAGPRTIDATLDNKGTVTVNRDATVSGTSPAHTNTGVIKVTAGNLTFAPGGANPTFTNLAGGGIDIGASRTLKFTAGTVTNSASGRINGFGTLDVSAATFSNDGDLFPGTSPGVLTINAGTGTVPFSSTGSLNIELTGVTQGTQYDFLPVTGSASWSGILNVTLSFTPTPGQTFVVAQCSVTCTGRFGTENLPPGWQPASYVGNRITLTAP